jgi:hypothetical protein
MPSSPILGVALGNLRAHARKLRELQRQLFPLRPSNRAFPHRAPELQPGNETAPLPGNIHGNGLHRVQFDV